MKYALVTCIVPLAVAQAQNVSTRPHGWPPGDNIDLKRLEYVLTENTSFEYDNLTIEDGVIIRTSGYDLDLTVNNILTIKGTLTIRAFDDPQKPDTPTGSAATGERGQPHYHRGPDVDGDASTEDNGAAGGKGGRGSSGAPGVVGFEAGSITIKIGPQAKVSGKLVVLNVGGRGGTGGMGGQGGIGGDGQQGGRCRAYQIGSEAGRGGDGGQGGLGGFGGRGGDGGRGGQIFILTESQPAKDWLSTMAILSVDGGQPGTGGQGGKGGNGGQPGYGGRGAQLCSGQVGEKMGQPGLPGDDETKALEGAQRGPRGIIKRF